MRKCLMAAAAVLLLASVAVASQSALDLPVTEFTLANGMRFRVLPLPALPTVAACIQFKVGSADERPGQTGACQMIERMMFEGTADTGTWNDAAEKPIVGRIDGLADRMTAEQAKLATAYGGGEESRIAALKSQILQLQTEDEQYAIPDDLRQIYRRNGARGVNAATWEDGTCFYARLPANRLEVWACLESDRMVHPVFRDFYGERDALVQASRRQDPDARLFAALQQAAYPASPYRQPPTGWPSDLASMRRQDVQRFFDAWYGPNNAVAVLVGDVDAAEVKALAEKYFAPIPARPVPARVPTQDPPPDGQRRVALQAGAHPEIYLAFPGPKFGDRDEFVLDVIAEILSRGRLPFDLVERQRLASGTFAYNYTRRLGNLFVIGGAPQGAHTIAQLESRFWHELNLLKSKPVTAAELKEAMRRLDADFIRGLTSRMALARQIANAEALTGDWHNFDTRSRWQAVTSQRIMQAARRWFRMRNSAVATMGAVKR